VCEPVLTTALVSAGPIAAAVSAPSAVVAVTAVGEALPPGSGSGGFETALARPLAPGVTRYEFPRKLSAELQREATAALRAELGVAAAHHSRELAALHYSIPLLVQRLGGEFTHPRMNAERIRARFGGITYDPEKWQLVLAIAETGIVPPVKGRVTSNDHFRWRICGTQQAPEHALALLQMLAQDVEKGHTLLFTEEVVRHLPNLVVFPVYGIDKDDGAATRRIMDLTRTHRPGDSINGATDGDCFPKCAYGDALQQIFECLYRLRLGAPGRHIFMRYDDVAAAYRQLKMDPRYAELFAYRMAGMVAVEARATFGWKCSPQLFDLFAQLLQTALRQATLSTPVSAEAVRIVAEHYSVVVPGADVAIAPVAADPNTEPLVLDEHSGGLVFHHVDDGVSLDTRPPQQLLTMSAILVDLHLQLFGQPPNLSKMVPWGVQLYALGLEWDTAAFTISLPQHKLQQLREIVFTQFHRGRATATVKELRTLLGKLHHFALCVRPGRFFLGRLQKVANDGGTMSEHSTQPLTAEFHGDLVMWEWMVTHYRLSTSISMPMWAHVRRTPAFMAFSDASRFGVGGYCPERRVCWQLDWPADIKRRYNAVADTAAQGEGPIYVNACELLGMVMTAWLLLYVEGASVADEHALLYGDNSTAA
jgi:hypothetical protein